MEDLADGSQGGLSHEAEPVRWLRTYSNYLSPVLGFLSADSWTLVGIYLRNLLLNWLVLLPLLMTALLAPRALSALVQLNARGQELPKAVIVATLLLGVGFVVIALIYLHLCRPHLHELRVRYGFQRLETQAWFLKACLAPLLLSTLCLTVSWAWFRNADGGHAQLPVAPTVLGALVIHVGSWLFTTLALRRLQFFGAWFLGEMAVVAVTGAVGGFFVWSVLANIPLGIPVERYAEWYACFGIPGYLAMFLLTATLFIGVASRVTDDHDREWWGRTGSWVLIAMALWMMLCGVVIFGPGLMAYMPKVVASLGGLSGLITLVLGFGPKTPATVEAERSWLSMGSELASKAAAPIFMLFILILLALGSSWLLDALSSAFGPRLSAITGEGHIGLHMPADPWNHGVIVHNATLSLVLLMGILLALLGIIMAVTININQFSLHAMYRNRLIRAYLGASRCPEERRRLFNPLTGFDPRDNESMCNLRFDDVRLARALYRDQLSEATRRCVDRLGEGAAHADLEDLERLLIGDIRRLVMTGMLTRMTEHLGLGPACAAPLKALSDTPPDRQFPGEPMKWLSSLLVNRLHRLEARPLHVLNLALNLVRGDNLAWQERKAQSFTVSALHCGSSNLGYRRSQDYGKNILLNRPISLGTALAISGAAASPNMGYHSSPAVTFLLALFNVRLGWWLGNPGPAGAKTYDRSSPAFAVGPLFSEAFGLTDAGHPYVYLSDGGHFENLGLYEMVLRRCRSILVIDAGCDPTGVFEDLGNAIRKIQIDLGIEIDMDLDLLERKPAGLVSRGHHAIGTIRYDKVDATAGVGTILYMKPSLTGDEPTDVREYAARHPQFPHEPTSDQFFDESQFQSYSRLGEHAAWEVLSPVGHCAADGFTAVCEELRDRWVTTPPAMQDFFFRETPGLARLNDLLRSDPELARYDAEVYPELQSLFGYQSERAVSIDRRAALHVCNAQLQVMERVFYALKLDEFHAHPLSRGWMNLFRRWAAAATLREFWPALCAGYSRQFLDFARCRLNLVAEDAWTTELCRGWEVVSPIFDELSRECRDLADYPNAFREAFQQAAPLDPARGLQGGAARWVLRLSPTGLSGNGPRTEGELLAVAAAMMMRERELGVFIWTRPAYRGLGAGSRLVRTCLESVGETYAGYGVVADLGPDDPSARDNQYEKAGWLKFYERLGFTRDGSVPGRLRMVRTLK
jgi:GNAT superfamily N-acetyltransferase